MTDETARQDAAEKDRQKRWRWANYGANAAIVVALALVLLAVCLSIYQAGIEKEPEEVPPQKLDLGLPAIEQLVEGAQTAAVEATIPMIDDALDPVFAPVHAAVPVYADWHYSVLGEYTEITEALMGDVTTQMEKKLFDGFDARLETALGKIEGEYLSNIEQEISASLEERRAASGEGTVISAATMAGVRDTVGRLKVTGPVDAIAAIGAAKIGASAASKALSKSLLKFLGKLGVKTVAKPLGVGAGAAGGAAVGSFVGPVGTAIGGFLGMGVALVGVDYATVKLDEYLNRDAFIEKLHGMIDDEQEELRQSITDYFRTRQDMEGGTTIREVREAR